jgi:hypothetical protein
MLTSVSTLCIQRTIGSLTIARLYLCTHIVQVVGTLTGAAANDLGLGTNVAVAPGAGRHPSQIICTMRLKPRRMWLPHHAQAQETMRPAHLGTVQSAAARWWPHWAPLAREFSDIACYALHIHPASSCPSHLQPALQCSDNDGCNVQAVWCVRKPSGGPYRQLGAILRCHWEVAAPSVHPELWQCGRRGAGHPRHAAPHRIGNCTGIRRRLDDSTPP